jgi:hypothetical protein
MTDRNPIDQLILQSELPVVVADHLGIVRHVNALFERVWGWPESRIVGQALAVLVPPEFHNGHNAGFCRFLVSGRGTILEQPVTLPLIDGTGLRKQAEICLYAHHIAGEWQFAATASPVPATEV